MNVTFGSIPRLFALDACELVTSKYALSNSGPIALDCARQADLTFRADGWISLRPPRCQPAALVGRPSHQSWTTEPVEEKEVLGQDQVLRRLGAGSTRPRPDSEIR